MATSLEDIVNVDMLGLNPEDNSSPDSTFLTMPPTPPPMGDAADLFKFYFDQHMSELAKQQPVPFSFGSPMFAQVPPVIAQPDPNFFIDPALMMAPLKPAQAPKPVAAIKSASSVAADDEDDEDIEEDDDDIEQFLARPIKVAGRGKAIGRKGTVAAGGIKKFGGQAVKDSDDPEDWRPTVEEYKKMTPKEKRQLRNKISARNFRVRRKEYITTLEGDVAERDNLIELIREELGATKLENEALKREVDALKRAMLEGRVELDLPPPGPLSPATNTAANTPAKRSTRSAKAAPMPKANTRKDVARSGSTFWGGVAGAGGVAQVHTTLVPDFEFDELQENMNPALNNLATADAKASVCGEPDLNVGFEQFADANPFNIRSQEQYRMQLWERIAREAGPGALNTALGINAASSVFGRSAVSSPASSVPGLASSPSSSNSTPSPALAPMGFERLHHSPSPPPGVQIGINGLPFATMPHPMSPLSGLAANARPMYLDQAASRDSTDRTAPRPSLAELLTGKKTGESSSSALKVPPPKAIEATPEQSALAVAASHTLLSKLRDAFWDAFSLGSPTAESKKKDWDPEKVRRVLDGSAVVRVVDVEPEQQAKAESVATITDPAAALEESMRTLSLRNGASASAVASVQMQTGHDVKKDAPASSGVDALTGVFSNLRLARTAARS